MIQRTNKKFTLIELIIVIVTISILAGMALPKFVDVKRQAEHSKLLNNIDAVEKSIAICELQKGDYPIFKDKVDFYSLNDTVQAQVLANGETGENLYKVRVNDTSKKTLSGGIIGKVFAAEEGAALETQEFHSKLKYGLGKYGVNDYYIYSKESGNVYYANGDLLEDSQSSIAPLDKDGTYYMTVNAGDTAKWIDHIKNEYIPDGGSIEYEWAAFDDPNLKKKNDKLNWTDDFESLPNTQFLKTKITIKSPENGEQTKLLKYRVQYLIDDIEYDEVEIDDIQLKHVVRNSNGTYTSTSPSGGSISITINNSNNQYSRILNNFGGNYNYITVSSGSNSSAYGICNSYSLGDIHCLPNGPVTINIYIPNGNSTTIPQKVIFIKEKEEDWETIDELTFECDAMEETKWIGFDYDGFIPENTRIKVNFSTSDDDSFWSDEIDNITNVPNSRLIKARIELQVNKFAKQIPTISEVFFDNETNGKRKRINAIKKGLSNNISDEDTPDNTDNNISNENLWTQYDYIVHISPNQENTLINTINNVEDNTLIVLDDGEYVIDNSIIINKRIGILGNENKTRIRTSEKFSDQGMFVFGSNNSFLKIYKCDLDFLSLHPYPFFVKAYEVKNCPTEMYNCDIKIKKGVFSGTFYNCYSSNSNFYIENSDIWLNDGDLTRAYEGIDIFKNCNFTGNIKCETSSSMLSIIKDGELGIYNGKYAWKQ